MRVHPLVVCAAISLASRLVWAADVTSSPGTSVDARATVSDAKGLQDALDSGAQFIVIVAHLDLGTTTIRPRNNPRVAIWGNCSEPFPTVVTELNIPPWFLGTGACAIASVASTAIDLSGDSAATLWLSNVVLYNYALAVDRKNIFAPVQMQFGIISQNGELWLSSVAIWGAQAGAVRGVDSDVYISGCAFVQNGNSADHFGWTLDYYDDSQSDPNRLFIANTYVNANVLSPQGPFFVSIGLPSSVSPRSLGNQTTTVVVSRSEIAPLTAKPQDQLGIFYTFDSARGDRLTFYTDLPAAQINNDSRSDSAAVRPLSALTYADVAVSPTDLEWAVAMKENGAVGVVRAFDLFNLAPPFPPVHPLQQPSPQAPIPPPPPANKTAPIETSQQQPPPQQSPPPASSAARKQRDYLLQELLLVALMTGWLLVTSPRA